jgi:hypothetical protein
MTGLPDFFVQLTKTVKTIPMTTKCAKRPQDLPNGCQIFQMAIKYTNILHIRGPPKYTNILHTKGPPKYAQIFGLIRNHLATLAHDRSIGSWQHLGNDFSPMTFWLTYAALDPTFPHIC